DSLRKSSPQQPVPPPRPAVAPSASTGTTGTSAPLTPKLAVVWGSPEPTYDEGTIDRIAAALKVYHAIEELGGWPTLPASVTKLAAGGAGPEVALLRQRLAITNDIDQMAASGESFDAAVVAAVKHFQLRHGLTPTGSIGPQTLAALNVPVEQ